MSSMLDNLPVKVIQYIASCLDAKSAVALSSTCRKCRDALGDDSNLWKHLALAQIGNNPSEQLPTTRSAFCSFMMNLKKADPLAVDVDDVVLPPPLLDDAATPSADTVALDNARKRLLKEQSSAPKPLSSSLPAQNIIHDDMSPTTGAPSDSSMKKRQSLFDDDDDEDDDFLSGDHGDEVKEEDGFDVWLRRAKERSENRRLLAASTFDPTVQQSVKPLSDALEHQRKSSRASPLSVSSSVESDYSTTNFRDLIELPESRALKSAMGKFVKNFNKVAQGDVDLQKRTLNVLFSDMERAMKVRPLWKNLPPSRFSQAKIEMQRYVFEEVFHTLYYNKELQMKDATTAAHYAALREVITPEFLDMKPEAASNTEALMRAVVELEMIEEVKSPLEKLTCIYNCSRILTFILSTNGAMAGADDFLPVFIYVVVNSNLPHLESDMEYIRNYIDPDEQFGEAYCYYTHLISAKTFLDSQQPEQVIETIQHRKQEAKRKAEMEKRLAALNKIDPSSGNKFGIEEQELSFIRQLHFMYSSASTLCDPEDIQLLLSEYRTLYSVCRRNVMRFTGKQPWQKEPRFVRHIVEFPDGAVITSMFALLDYAWVGFENGRVGVFSFTKAAIVCTLSVFSEPVVKILAVDKYLWCVSESGHVRMIDPNFFSLQPIQYSLHNSYQKEPEEAEKKSVHSESPTSRFFKMILPSWPLSKEEQEDSFKPVDVAPKMKVCSVIYDPVSNVGWSAARIDLGGPGKSVVMKTELSMFSSTGAETPQRIMNTDGAVLSLCSHDEKLYALLTDGSVKMFDECNGNSLPVLAGEEDSESQASQFSVRYCMCCSNDGTLWLGNGEGLQCACGDKPNFSKHVVDGLKPDYLRITHIDYGLPPSLPSSPTNPIPQPLASLMSSGIVVSATDSGLILVWNVTSKTPCMVIGTGPKSPELLSCTVRPSSTYALSVFVSKQNKLYCWLLEAESLLKP